MKCELMAIIIIIIIEAFWFPSPIKDNANKFPNVSHIHTIVSESNYATLDFLCAEIILKKTCSLSKNDLTLLPSHYEHEVSHDLTEVDLQQLKTIIIVARSHNLPSPQYSELRSKLTLNIDKEEKRHSNSVCIKTFSFPRSRFDPTSLGVVRPSFKSFKSFTKV